MAYDVKSRKKQLIRDNINKDKKAERARAQVVWFVVAVVLLRIALLVYKLVYFPSVEATFGITSDVLLLLGGIILLYMVTDGNRGLLWVTAISSVVWCVWCFTSVYPAIAEKPGSVAYMAVFLFVMAVQFILSVIMAAIPFYDTYFDKMQKINLTIRAELISGGGKK